MAGYPAVMLKTLSRSYFWKSSVLTSGQTLTLDLGAAHPCDFVIVDAHNFALLGSTVIALEASTDLAFTSPVEVVPDLKSPDPVILLSFTSASYQYWRLKFVSSVSVEPLVGIFIVGLAVDFPYTENYGGAWNDKQFDTVKEKNVSGTFLAAQAYDGKQVVDTQFTNMPDSLASHVNYFVSLVRGSLVPFYFQTTDGSLYFGTFGGDSVEILSNASNLNDFSVTFSGRQ